MMNRHYGSANFYGNEAEAYFYQQGFVTQPGDQYYQNDFYNPSFPPPPGYSLQPMYPSYPTAGYNVNYYEDMSQGSYQSHQGFAGESNNIAQDNSKPTRSKHSYSQNRFKGRQNSNRFQADGVQVGFTHENQTTNDDKSDVNNTASKDTNENQEKGNQDTSVRKGFGSYQKQRDGGEFRRGRFQGSDSRTRVYDNNQQTAERKQNYNRNFNAHSHEDKVKPVTDRWAYSQPSSGVEDSVRGVPDKTGNGNSQQGSRVRSYKDGRRSRCGRNEKHDQDPNSIETDLRTRKGAQDANKPNSTEVKDKTENTNSNRNNASTTVETNVQTSTTAVKQEDNKEKTTGARKKRREVQIFSSRGQMDVREYGCGRNSAYSPREMGDRYNFRGQDYNKRHKDTMVERGGSQTKLSTTLVDDLETLELEDKEEELDAKQHSTTKSGYNNIKRGTRSKPKEKMDENQREVLISQLTKGTYECMVCCEAVRAQNALWSCSSCYHMFHLRCIKRWARSPNSVVTGADRDGWRCPACQNLSFQFPNQYRCFCGKVRDPEVCRMEIPHSCGDVCQKSRGEDCKHPCNILCHPGPCPDCKASITKSCDCGKSKRTAVCGQSAVIKCDQVCERLLNCGSHFCTDKCHTGPCLKCEQVIKQECYGGHESREVICGTEESFTQSYSCDRTCSKPLDCGHHSCERPCHIGSCESCPMLPTNLTHCPCGTVALHQLTSEPRTSCLDPIPTCTGVCNKPLTCGPEENRHTCHRQCHEGPCGPCEGSTLLTCRCQCREKEVKCSEMGQLTDENGQFLCDKRCNKKKQCGRHKCGQMCCVLTDHPCDMICGRKLPCGLHKCMEPCHRNNCPPCLMAGFDELTCHCGIEVLFPPIPCGTKPPECHRPCSRQHDCDHEVRHNCHSDDHCAPCTELTSKMCMGNHVKRSNIPCHLTDISCGMKCGKPLPCREHLCVRTCHKGECLDEESECSQPCQRKRDHCDHICGAPCHGEKPCPSTPCKATVQMRCACGHRETETTCWVGAPPSDFQRITMQSLKESIQGSMGASTVNLSKFHTGQGRMLECTEGCALLERNKRMAVALQILNPDLSSKLGSPSYSDFLKDYAKKDATFVASVEKAFSDLVQSAKTSKRASRSHPFPSMNQPQRRLVHELAEHYGCQTQSYDFEPKKNVVATAMRDKCWLPSMSLTTLVQRELHPRAPPPIPHLHREDSLRLTNQAAKQSTNIVGDTGSGRGATPLGAEGWQIIGKKTSKKSSSGTAQKSAIATIDKFETNLETICTSGMINYSSLSSESKEALKAEPVVDYFDFTVT